MGIEDKNPISVADTPRLAESRQVCFREQIVIFGILLFVLAATYSSALFLHYGLNDDYGLLLQGLTYPPQIHMGLVTQGRLIDAWLVEFAFSHVGSLGNLWQMRAVGVVGLACSAWVLQRLVRRAGWDRISAIAFAIAACTVPAAQVYATWANDFAVTWALLLALLAGWLTGVILNGGSWRFLLSPIVAALLLASIITYQPAGMVFVAVMLLDVFSPRLRNDSVKAKIGQLTFYQAINAVALYGGFWTFHWGMRKYPTFLFVGRTGLDKNLWHKPAWFVKNPLLEAMNLWHMPGTARVAWIVSGILLAGLLLYFFSNWKICLLGLSTCAIALPVAYVPNLLSEDADAYRTHIGMSWAILVMALFTLTGIWQSILRIWRASIGRRQDAESSTGMAPALPRAIVVLAAVAAAACAAYTTTAYITWPHALELAALRIQLANPRIQSVHHFIFLQMTSYDDTAAPGFINEEFGSPSIANAIEWEPMSAVYLIQRETRPRIGLRDVKMIPFHPQRYSDPVPPDTALIDLRYFNAAR